MLVNEEVLDYLKSHDVTTKDLDQRSAWAFERRWRAIYGDAFERRSRLRHGSKAESEYSQLVCCQYRVIRISSNVRGTPVNVRGSDFCGVECTGSLVPFGRFSSIEFFISPIDFEWTMVHTHEDHAFGGPYFIKAEWIL